MPAVVIGGGFYGCSIALYLKTVRGMRDVILLESGSQLMGRSSFVNQARVHNGYHYPRSFTTAYRSRVNAPRFLEAYAPAIVSNFTQVYALARRNSKITAPQFERFCREIGAPLAPAPRDIRRLFDATLVSHVFTTVEQAFDAVVLRDLVERQLHAAGVELRLNTDVRSAQDGPDGVRVDGHGPDGPFSLPAALTFNCTYSRLATLRGPKAGAFPLKHEIAEMVLVEPPDELAGVGVTVMDGPFFSCMPFPARRLHSLSHVRYTPHVTWMEDHERDPYDVLASYDKESRADRMRRDAARYVPALARCEVRGSLFEVKTILNRNEGDDGRPILFERHAPHGRLFSVLGGKIDNIFDILERLDDECFPHEPETPAQWTA